MGDLDRDLAFFGAQRAELEAKHLGKWVLLHDGALAGVFGNFDAAASEAVSKFGRGPYLLRQVGAPPLTLPASVMYSFANGAN